MRTRQNTEMRHICLKYYKTRDMLVKQGRFFSVPFCQICLRDFPIFGGIFPIGPFPLSRPFSFKHLRTFPKGSATQSGCFLEKSGKPSRFGNPRFSFFSPRSFQKCPFSTHLFLRILLSFFFFFPCPPHPSPGNFFPQILSFWDLRSTLSSREKATSRGWVLGTVLDGVAPKAKKDNPSFSGTQKKVSLELGGFKSYSL